MGPLPKYVLFSCAALGLAWTSVSVDIRGRTPYGYFLAAGGDAWIDGARSSWASAWRSAENRWDGLLESGREESEETREARPRERRRRPSKAYPQQRPTVQEENGAKRRVALLEKAEKQMKRQKRPKKTEDARMRLDRPATRADRDALDRLVEGR